MKAVLMILQLLLGLSVFLFGMDTMGDALKKSAGKKLKGLLAKMTTNPIMGFMLGLVVTAIIQSSSATTVMVVGFVNSGTMTLLQSVGVILGANLGTAVTAWLTAPAAMGSGDASETFKITDLFKTDMWMPILAVIGIVLFMFINRGKKKDIGTVLLGFAVLMVGMDLMSGSVSELKSSPAFTGIFTMFQNPILGLIAGLVITVIVQSSSASVGILQSIVGVGGVMSFGGIIPIVIGQNIGTCVTAMLSSIGANKNGKRAAVIHLSFNIISAFIVMVLFYGINLIFGCFDSLMEADATAWSVAVIHSVYKIIAIAIVFPFYKQLEKLSHVIVKDKKGEKVSVNILDERLFETPSIAVGRATEATYGMAAVSVDAFEKAISLTEDKYDIKIADTVRELETKADQYEDMLGSYLVKLSAKDMDMRDSEQITKLLHIIGDLERISDHAVNIVESAEEMQDKKLAFSNEAQREISVLREAVKEILSTTYKSLINNDIALASDVEPLEEVVDDLRDQIKLNHILRLQKSECTIEHGFVLSDILNNYERISDHCSNIAGCVIEIARDDALDMHKYLESMKKDSAEFKEKYETYKQKYSLANNTAS